MAAPLTIEPDDVNERFEQLEILGAGSFGIVKKCLDRKTGQLVALKFLEKGGEDLEEVAKEISLLKACANPDVINYTGCFETPDELVIAMEYAAGGSILDIMKICKREWDEDEIAAVMCSAVRGLAHLHAQKVLHRDLKAANILLDDNGHCKLADFGVAVQVQSTLSKRGTVIGSPYWMAPEVIDSSAGGYNSSCDVWSLGITAIEMAEGEPPLFHVHFARVLFMIPRQPPPQLKDPALWNDDFVDFLAKCLQKKATDRPTAAQLLEHPFIKRGATKQALLRDVIDACMPVLSQARRKFLEDEQNGGSDDDDDSGTLVGEGTFDGSTFAAGGYAGTFVRSDSPTGTMKPSK